MEHCPAPPGHRRVLDLHESYLIVVSRAGVEVQVLPLRPWALPIFIHPFE